MKVGAQMYTIREFCKTPEEIVSSLEKLAKIGFDCVQFSGCGPIDWKLLRETCDRVGIEVIITHTPYERIINDTDNLIKEHQVLGCNCIGLGSMPKEARSDKAELEKFLDAIAEPIKKINAAGLRFNYHNHAFEFNKLEGKTLIEHILDRYDATELGITLDQYWVHQSGADVYQWIDALKGRLSIVHIKDQKLEDDQKTAKMAPIGYGNMNFPGIMKAFKDAGTEYVFIEQDKCYDEDPFDCLERSLKYLRSIGY